MRRAGWGVGDQALSSLTNFALGILVARSVSTEALGAFGLAFGAYTVFLNIARSIGTQPLIVRFSGPPDEPWRVAVRSSTAVALATGIGGGLLCAVVAVATDGALRQAFAALAVTLPGLMLQDAWRFAFFSVARGKAAFMNDLVWAVCMLPAVVVLSEAHAGMLALVLAWGLSATVAAVVGLWQSGLRPALGRLPAWWRAQRDLAVRFTAESLTQVLSNVAVLYGLGLVVGLAAVGALRAAQLLLGPMNILLQGVQLVATPEAVGAARRGRSHLVRVVRLVAVALFGLVGAFGAVVLLFADSVGTIVLGDNWSAAQPLLVPVIVGYLGIAGTFACTVGLRALAAASRSLRATVITAAFTVTLGIAGAVAGAANSGGSSGAALGAAWGLAIAALLGLATWALELRAGLAEQRAPVPERVTA